MPRCPNGTQKHKRTGKCVKKGQLRCPNGTRKRRLRANDNPDVVRECIIHKNFSSTSTQISSRRSNQTQRVSSSPTKEHEVRNISPITQRRVVEAKPQKKKRGIFHKLMKIIGIRK